MGRETDVFSRAILPEVFNDVLRLGLPLLVVSLSLLMFFSLGSKPTQTDPSTNDTEAAIWLSTTPLPHVLANSPAISSERAICMFGGRIGGSPGRPEITNTVYYGTIGADGSILKWESNWETGDEPLPRKLCYGAIAMAEKGWICVTGGAINTEPYSLNIAYYGKLEQDRVHIWITPTPSIQPIPRCVHASVASFGRIYVMGGQRAIKRNRRWEVETLKSVQFAASEPVNGKIDGWYSASDSNLNPVFGHAAVEYEGNIYLMGGHNGTTPVDSVYHGVVDQGSGEIMWTQLVTASLPISLYYHSAIVLNRNIYVIGGSCGDGKISDKVYRATINNDDGTLSSWTPVPSLRLPKPLQDHSSVVANGRLYVIGGVSYDGYQNSVYYTPFISFSKSADPPGEVECGDVIRYTMHYAANMEGITLTNVWITDVVPSNVRLDESSIAPTPTRLERSDVVTMTWNIGELSVQSGSGEIFFKVKVSEAECGYDDPPTPTPTATPTATSPPTFASAPTEVSPLCTGTPTDTPILPTPTPTATPTCACTDPIIVINRAWISSDQESREVPSINSPLGIYLPIIMRSGGGGGCD